MPEEKPNPTGRPRVRRRTPIAVAVLVVVAVLAAAFIATTSQPAPWRILQTFTGGPCDGVLTCRTPAFAVAATQWKVTWDIRASRTFQIDLYIGTPDPSIPVSGGWLRTGQQGEWLSPVGAGTWVVFFTTPNGNDTEAIESWSVTTWVR